MEQRINNPWKWQDAFGYSQAIETVGGQSVLYCAGQTSMSADGSPVHSGDMRAQLTKSFDNLEEVLKVSGYSLSNVVRLNYYTTDIDAFFAAYDSAMTRLDAASCKPASTLLGVARLAFPELMIEIEATAVK
jgi:enamine deaminase RidA (YjgF/YER057c/UK114 family)